MGGLGYLKSGYVTFMNFMTGPPIVRVHTSKGSVMTRIFSLFCAIAVKFMVFDIHGIDSQYKRILSKIIIRATKLEKNLKIVEN